MPTVGHLTISQLHRLIKQTETDPNRRERLFGPFGGPSAAVQQGLTNHVLEFVISEQKSMTEALILDYGCGVIPYIKAFELAGARIVGADVGKNSYAEIELKENGMLPIANDSFDYVVSFQVLEHVPAPQDYLQEAYRVLKPGGKLFLTTHGIWPYHPTPGDYHRWTVSGLLAEIERAGFCVQSRSHVLNEYAALIQNFVITAEYRGVLKYVGGFVHYLTHLLIIMMEKIGRHETEIPAVICITGGKS